MGEVMELWVFPNICYPATLQFLLVVLPEIVTKSEYDKIIQKNVGEKKGEEGRKDKSLIVLSETYKANIQRVSVEVQIPSNVGQDVLWSSPTSPSYILT